jgi:hypothetical protein
MCSSDELRRKPEGSTACWEVSVTLLTTHEDGWTIVEATPDERLPERGDDAAVRVVEECLSAGTDLALLHAANLPPAFFDLSSRVAGDVLQKIRNYRIRLAVVCPPGAVRFSSRFGEMLADERRLRHFDVFEMREEAVAWLSAR